jgi:hypothetical protein
LAVLSINQEQADYEGHHVQRREHKLPLSATHSRRHRRSSRTSTKSELPLSTSLFSPFGLRGFGCSAVLKSFDSSKNGSDFLFLVWRFTPCDDDPGESRLVDREPYSCLAILQFMRFACPCVVGLQDGIVVASTHCLRRRCRHSEDVSCVPAGSGKPSGEAA